jgi:DNA-binding CsgD family transcriptional regulator
METTLIDAKAEQLKWEIGQLRLSNKIIRSVQNENEQIFNVAVPLCVISNDFKILRVNSTFCDKFLDGKNNGIGAACHSIWKSTLCGTPECPLKAVVKTRNAFSTEGVKTLSDGRKIACIISANPFYDAENRFVGIVGNIVDITPRKILENELNEKRRTLIDQNLLLEEKNAALKELMVQFKAEKVHGEEQILENIRNLILPLIVQLKERCSGSSSGYLDLIESNLNQITSGFGKTLSDTLLKLTQKEMLVCNLIKNGLETKEVAAMMHLSIKTIETHRKSIRKKLGLTQNRQNLVTYLQSVIGR